MRHTLALIFALCTLFVLPAHADDSCVPYLECKPLVTKAVRGPVGTHLFWFVRNETTGGIDHHGFSCLHAACDLQQFKDAANDVLTGKMTAQEAWREYMSFECDYTVWTEVAGELPICRERKNALLTERDAWLEGIPRQVVMWRVKYSSGFSTRPAYLLTNGVLSTRIWSRGNVGAPCDMTKPYLVSGKDRWAVYVQPNNLKGWVSLCARVQP